MVVESSLDQPLSFNVFSYIYIIKCFPSISQAPGKKVTAQALISSAMVWKLLYSVQDARDPSRKSYIAIEKLMCSYMFTFFAAQAWRQGRLAGPSPLQEKVCNVYVCINNYKR
ncbi:unnamed protein product [Cuscuta epithymum]|uniref:Uncharacterized protein n=1 Tax=Cuscuta epithymum TaxID=186058 RepID=A0AAV0FII1_9ASTE|nr:unnamed protein product [Cuscuta epithymum]